MTEVVTIFSCGTASSRTSNYAVPYTYKLTKGRKWINDGPGSNRGPKKVEAILKRAEAGKGVPESMFGKKYSANSVYGKLLGSGTQDNIVMSLQWLWEQYYSRPFSTINLAGWSRGAVTSIKLAHAIQAAGFGLKGVRVNIFAYDPVPGWANDFDLEGTFATTGRAGDSKTLAPIVSQYEAVLMENVDGMLGLKPLLFKSVSPRIQQSEIPARASGGSTSKTEYPLPGGHATCVKYNNASNPVGQIAVHLLHDHLLRHGTELTANDMRPRQSLLELYAATRMKYSRRSGKKIRAQRVRAKLVVNQHRDDVFFVNGHHYSMFREALPQVWSNISREVPLTQGMITSLQRSHPTTLAALIATGVVEG